MLQQADCLGLNKLVDHVAQDGSDSVEPFVGMTDIGETSLIQEDLLYNEDGNSLRKLRSRLHNAQAKGYNFRRQQEVNNSVVVILLVNQRLMSS